MMPKQPRRPLMTISLFGTTYFHRQNPKAQRLKKKNLSPSFYEGLRSECRQSVF